MEPRIQYVKTSDGVNIAYWSIGDGPPVVYMPVLPASHIQLEWQIPEFRSAYERAARRYRYIRYDARGFGMSDREVSDLSLDAFVTDLEAVSNHLNLARYRLIAPFTAAAIAIAYAARHPDRISHLVLWHGQATPSQDWVDLWAELRGTMERDLELGSELVAYASLGGADAELVRQLAPLFREAVTAGRYDAFTQEMRMWDVRHLLPDLKVRTLVMQRQDYRLVPNRPGPKAGGIHPGR